MLAIILSGGSGSRLWPLSREYHPKQFLSFNSHLTLFQETFLRACGSGPNLPIVICNKENKLIISENLEAINYHNITMVLEPCPRNTAPAIALAALLALDNIGDQTLLALPSDHLIEDNESLNHALKTAEKLAEEGFLVTLGVKPTRSSTEHGYIEFGKQICSSGYAALSFKEKPTQQVASDFLKQGNYLWNSGIFVFKASKYLDALGQHHPTLLQQIKNCYKSIEKQKNYIIPDEETFMQCDNVSIDYAVMEKANNIAVVMLDSGWHDLGTWQSMWDASQKDKKNNVCNGDIISEDCQNNYFYSQNRLITAAGVNNLVIVDTNDALLVADKSTTSIKKLVKRMQQENRTETKLPKIVYRPWGHYDVIGRGERDLVKRITVKPGAKLSYQMHYHRSEHWVIVKGTAKVTKGKKELLLTENESIYLSCGMAHSLQNPGKIPLEIIEVQTGPYLAEDDIVRFEDEY